MYRSKRRNLKEWLQYIETQHSSEIELGLDRVRTVANELKLTKFGCKVVTIGGTNGKGSCVKFLESILHANGYRVGAYTSPHLLSFNERIRLFNDDVTDELLLQAFEVVDAARIGEPLTFFEFTTLAALWIFQQMDLDVVLLEVGLGGRLDAVNIVDSDIAIVTSVDLDHMDWLGTTREAIGYEKAGIFRSNSVAICGDREPPLSLVEHARAINCRLYIANQDYHYEQKEIDWAWSEKHALRELPLPNLPIQNAATALMAIRILQENLMISLQAIVKGLRSATLRGRFQTLANPKPMIIDVAHNPASAKMLANNLSKQDKNHRFIAVVGMLADKDIRNTLAPLTPLISEWYCGDLNVPRGAKASLLASHLRAFPNVKCYTHDSILSAYHAATQQQNSNDKLVIFGSFYTVAEILH